MQENGNELLTPREAAALLKINERTIRRWVASGKVAGFRVGGRREIRIKRADLLTMLHPAEVQEARP